jgi:hypothetical protein
MSLVLVGIAIFNLMSPLTKIFDRRAVNTRERFLL